MHCCAIHCSLGTLLVQNALLCYPLRTGYLFGSKCIVVLPIAHWVPYWCKMHCCATHCALGTFLVLYICSVALSYVHLARKLPSMLPPGMEGGPKNLASPGRRPGRELYLRGRRPPAKFASPAVGRPKIFGYREPPMTSFFGSQAPIEPPI